MGFFGLHCFQHKTAAGKMTGSSQVVTGSQSVFFMRPDGEIELLSCPGVFCFCLGVVR